MLTNHMKILLFCVISISKGPHYTKAEIKSIFPTQSEQVNLIHNVYDIAEQIKQSAKIEQNAMDESMEDDIEFIMKKSQYLISTLEELTLLKSSSRSNSVCNFDAQEKLKTITKKTYRGIEDCEKTIHDGLAANSLVLTSTIESAIKSGEDFLEKLNRCSDKRGLGLIACYKKIIDNDVIPAKAVISAAIENHRNCLIKSYGLKSDFNHCIERTVEFHRTQMDLELEAGIHC
ncbi:unnamed protein product [Ceutorhynchus assimilis]|uniref:Protein TsetseEP domain-containing protein n=1 Tax=Ceutorhynchus assimilis TaxID=467358 RepID=A0A9N9MAX5_9CUCU|nr:unnamed protein product [Ceutorhynchus assimilis]